MQIWHYQRVVETFQDTVETCQAWAILNGEKEIALCAHRIIADEVTVVVFSKTCLPISGSEDEAIFWIVEESIIYCYKRWILVRSANDLSHSYE